MPLARPSTTSRQEAFAAASIGQVHRATTKDGAKVAVKIQYPGIAEAVETDLRNAQMLFPLVKRLAPGLDVKALAQELRERIGDELDYEVEAQNHRAMARAWRNHPFVYVPAGRHAAQPPPRARHRVHRRAAGSSRSSSSRDDERDRFGEIVFRFFFGTLKHTRRAAGDPHPGNYLLLDDGRVGFLDFGLMRVVDADYLEQERQLAQAVTGDDAPRTHALLTALGYLPEPDTFDPEKLLAQIRAAGEWYLQPGRRRLDAAYVSDVLERSGSPRSEYFDQMRRETIPPQALLIRRMEGPRLRHPRRGPRRGRLARARQGILGRRAAEHAARQGRRNVLGVTSPTMLAAALATVALLPGLLTSPVADVKQDTKLPILLPSTLKSDEPELFASGCGHQEGLPVLRQHGGGLRRQRVLARVLQRLQGHEALRHPQGHAGQRHQRTLPAAELRRLVLAAGDPVGRRRACST